jgi:hypothetical protein
VSTLVTALLLLVALRCGSGGDPLTFTSEHFGFRITRASAAWTCLTAEEQSGVLFTVSMYPRGSEGVLIGDILEVRAADGSFADMPSFGRAYGTAQALLVFQHLKGE